MLSIKRGEADVTEGEQLTLDVRRDCDNEYLAKADRFIRAAVDDDTPFFCLLQPFLDAPARRSTR
jgi:arylsulfatase